MATEQQVAPDQCDRALAVFLKGIEAMGGPGTLLRSHNLDILPPLMESSFALVLGTEGRRGRDEIADYLGVSRGAVEAVFQAPTGAWRGRTLGGPEALPEFERHADPTSDDRPATGRMEPEFRAGAVAKFAYNVVRRQGIGRRELDAEAREEVLALLAEHNILTLATVRPDGYPQATTVSYVNDGLTLYCGVGADSQKMRNIHRNPKVSLTVDRDYAQWEEIRGLSMGAIAEVVEAPEEQARVFELMVEKYPQLKELSQAEGLGPFAVLRIRPRVISLLDYRRGFGHTELFEVT